MEFAVRSQSFSGISGLYGNLDALSVISWTLGGALLNAMVVVGGVSACGGSSGSEVFTAGTGKSKLKRPPGSREEVLDVALGWRASFTEWCVRVHEPRTVMDRRRG